MYAPSIIFSAAGAENVAIGELNWLVLDRTENAIGQAAWFGPMLSTIIRLNQHAQPSRWPRPNFVEEQERPRFWLKKNRIPARKALLRRLHPVGNLDGRCPCSAFVPRRPDAYILVLFARSAKPGRDQALFPFRNR